MFPNFLIIGAARSGTTWLAKNLMLHPEIFMPRIKEVHFFDRNYENGIKWYEDYFSDAKTKAVGEATPAYMYHQEAAERIKKRIPDVKLIALLRHPVDRAYSHYWYRVEQGDFKGATFEQVLNSTPRLVEEGLYADRLAPYYSKFSSDQLLIVVHDDLRNKPNEVLHEIYQYLGVDEYFSSALLENEINAAASKAGKVKSLDRISRALLRIGLYGAANWLEHKNRKQIPKLGSELRKSLLEKYFLQDLSDLETLIGRDLSAWKN